MGTPARYYSSTAVTTTLSLSISSTDVAIRLLHRAVSRPVIRSL